jgi:hypothetical protein
MANKKQIAIIASALAFIPPHLIANAQEIQVCDPDRVLSKCEKELYDAGIIWEERAESTRESFHGCLDKLAVRTSTVVNKIVLPAPLPKEDSLFSKTDLIMYSGMGMLGFILGTLVTAALVR